MVRVSFFFSFDQLHRLLEGGFFFLECRDDGGGGTWGGDVGGGFWSAGDFRVCLDSPEKYKASEGV